MLNAIFDTFHMTEHHGGGGVESEPMGHIHDLKPIIAHCFERRNALPHAVHQDFTTAAWNRTQTRGLELGDDVLERQSEHLSEMNELARTEAVNIELRKFGFDVGQQIQIPLHGQLWMM